VRIVAIVCMLAGVGCLPGQQRLQGDVTIGIVGLFQIAGDYRATDQAAVDRAAERKRKRENAEIRETSRKLQRELAVARRLPPARCLTASIDPRDAEQGRPESLDSSMISEAVAKIKGHVMACPESPSKGVVVVSVKVSAEGCVTAVTIASTQLPELDNCIVSSVEQASFASTQRGESFRYAFVF